MTLKVAINGFGRIGRIFFRQAFDLDWLKIVAINDLGSIENLAYLLKFDSVYGKYEKEVKVENNQLKIAGEEIKVFNQKDPAQLPWRDLNIDVVIEATGVFTTKELAQAHLKAGAKRVIITAPTKDDLTPTLTPNLNLEAISQEKITSNASCTTNAINPVLAILDEYFKIEKALMSTIHAYTATQNIVDGPTKSKDFRRGRAGAINIVPSSTGAAEAVFRVMPEFKDRFDALALRVPVISGSIIDLTALVHKTTTPEEVNQAFKESAENKWKGILKVSDEPLVSSDILKEPYGAIVDLSFTRVVGGNLIKVLAWYDNEWGYCAMLIKHLSLLRGKI